MSETHEIAFSNFSEVFCTPTVELLLLLNASVLFFLRTSTVWNVYWLHWTIFYDELVEGDPSVNLNTE